MATKRQDLLQQLEQLNKESKRTDSEVEQVLKRSDRVAERLRRQSSRQQRGDNGRAVLIGALIDTAAGGERQVRLSDGRAVWVDVEWLKSSCT